jgi:hypothetical protein
VITSSAAPGDACPSSDRTCEQDSATGAVSQPAFREDARWNAERQAVEFGVERADYHRLVRVPWRVLRRLLPERPTQAVRRSVQRPQFESVAEWQLRRRPLTEDGNVEMGSLPRRMNFNDRRALDLLPARIAALEARITQLNAVLADLDLYRRDPARFRDTTDALAVTRDELAAAEDQWLGLEMLLEEIEGIEPKA